VDVAPRGTAAGSPAGCYRNAAVGVPGGGLLTALSLALTGAVPPLISLVVLLFACAVGVLVLLIAGMWQNHDTVFTTQVRAIQNESLGVIAGRKCVRGDYCLAPALGIVVFLGRHYGDICYWLKELLAEAMEEFGREVEKGKQESRENLAAAMVPLMRVAQRLRTSHPVKALSDAAPDIVQPLQAEGEMVCRAIQQEILQPLHNARLLPAEAIEQATAGSESVRSRLEELDKHTQQAISCSEGALRGLFP